MDNLQESQTSADDYQEAGSTSQANSEREVFVKSKRKYLRGKITRGINRAKENINGQIDKRRLQKQIEEIREDYRQVLEFHGELYNYAEEGQTDNLDKWESELQNDVMSIEDAIEDYIATLTSVQSPPVEQPPPAVHTRSNIRRLHTEPNYRVEPSPLDRATARDNVNPTNNISQTTDIPLQTERPTETEQHVSFDSFDAWIDNLIEFKETDLNVNLNNLSMTEALYRLEASRDLPSLELPKFYGDPLQYVDFMDRFKTYVHDRPHLSDNIRMAQLKSHLKGRAEQAISGLGSGGQMYATALKMLKSQFGQPSVIARACISKLTNGCNIQSHNREALRDLSIDLVNTRATLLRINFFSDVNTNETLRQIIRRLPEYLLNQWKIFVSEIRNKGELPNIDHISKFIDKKVAAEYDPDFGDLQASSLKGQRSDFKSYQKKGIHATQTERKLECYICKENHRVNNCPVFAKSSVEDRVSLVKEHRLCFSCLTKGHVTKECRSKVKCDTKGCTRAHNSLLHTDTWSVSGSSPLDKSSILPVVRVLFRSANGKTCEGNVLVDSGAGTTIIRKGFAKSLGLQGKREALNLAVVGGKKCSQPNSRRLKFGISSLNGGEEYWIEAHEVDHTIISIPPLDRPWLKKFSHLSDIEFCHKAGPVDLILGVNYSHLHVESEVRQGLEFEPVAKQTSLGWYVIGSNGDLTPSVLSVNFMEKIDMRSFYEFETMGVQAVDCPCPKPAISREDRQAYEMLKSSCVKTEGRYTVALPWKRDKLELPDNYQLAEKRLISLEKSLQKSPKKSELYSEAISDYEKNGWSIRLTQEQLNSDVKPINYLPHHAIYRPDKLSTPVRIVFDPASPYINTSLNRFLHKGPGLIGNLLGVLFRFREEEIGFTGDISKMYLQVCLPEEDTHVHRYLWRDLDNTRKPTAYRLLRVTFGVKPSPDMASYVMLRIAEEVREHQPDVSEILERDRYMDDLIHSCPTIEVAEERMKGLETALANGSFKIKEWFVSSSKKHINMNSPDLDLIKDPDPTVVLDGKGDVKTLGMVWNPTSDTLHFSVKNLEMNTFTKRNVLSKMSKLYDPLGLAACVTIQTRVAMQDIWRLKDYDWDDKLPNDVIELWTRLFTDMETLRDVSFPRCIKPCDAIGKPVLHVFSDASTTAYGAVAYMSWKTPRGQEVNLVSAKSRVAPIHHTTVPRLELMGALIASRLASTILAELKNKPTTIYLWTDAQIVLHWLRTDSLSMKPFVGVRVAEIQNTWDPKEHWKFVPTQLNPADILTRGISPNQIHDVWTHGPDFLREPEENWPVEPVQPVHSSQEMKRPKIISAVQITQPIIDIERFSSWKKLLRVTGFCLRFISNLRSSKNERVKGPLQTEEISKAEHLWLKICQSQLTDWQRNQLDLSPYQDSDFIRVGGRLRKSQLSYDQIHPILLPANHPVSELIMRDIHQKSGHAGAERTLSDSRQQFWVLKGRHFAKRIVRHCTICRKLRQPTHSTLMADLPADRLRPFEPPFTVTGVDLFGPFFLKYGRNKSKKAWGAIFTCATSRCVHLEIVDNLSTEAFLQALRRFATHHGWPQTIISDNGSSFIGAEKELKILVREGRNKLQDFATLHKVTWKFITPLSPHQGGFYESLIKQVKRALRVAIGQQVLPWNEMSTVFAEIECLINSRPIGYTRDNPNDVQPLTPNHFILGRATSEIPQGPFQESKNLRKRFEFVQALVNNFWKRFTKEYIPTLMSKSKWQSKGRQLQIGDIVLLADYNLPRGKWNLGRIVEIYPGQDGIVRNVKVKTKSGEYQRSVQKCCPILEA